MSKGAEKGETSNVSRSPEGWLLVFIFALLVVIPAGRLFGFFIVSFSDGLFIASEFLIYAAFSIYSGYLLRNEIMRFHSQKRT